MRNPNHRGILMIIDQGGINMAAVKPSQSEPVDRFQRGSRGVGRAVPVSYKLDVFKDENFDPNVYVQSKCRAMSDKVVLILDFESLVALIREFTEGIPIESWSVDSEGSIEDDLSFCEDREPSEAEKLFVELPDMLDVLLSERRVAEALDALDEAERIAAEAAENQTLRPAELLSLQTIINKNRQKLADHLFEAAFKSSTHDCLLLSDSAYVSELVKWFAKQAEAFAQLVQKHVLASCADAGSLRAAAECSDCSWTLLIVGISGILLSSVLLQHFRPSVEEALNGNLKRIERKTAALAAADDWVLMISFKNTLTQWDI
ncbi:hypothetical protein J5N97_011013 [Dioscorea zingiberensis]|uniref:Uncharacterized protein n=1 Tax=Dioscorea zingiberensis TaxID=325984 RepID=A0A9D5HN71_9LILI|nr:hypothetical protein J5N97_011013 [Dioscorea zingiberensis]